MNVKEIRELTDVQLVHSELNCERELIDARFKKQLGTLESTGVFSKLRKTIARLRTEQRKRELDAGLPNNSLRNAHRPSFKPDSNAAESQASGAFLKGISEKLGKDD